MGWWVLAHGRVGGGGGGGGGEVVVEWWKAFVHHPLIHAPIARPAARETIAPPITHEHHVARPQR